MGSKCQYTNFLPQGLFGVDVYCECSICSATRPCCSRQGKISSANQTPATASNYAYAQIADEGFQHFAGTDSSQVEMKMLSQTAKRQVKVSSPSKTPAVAALPVADKLASDKQTSDDETTAQSDTNQ